LWKIFSEISRDTSIHRAERAYEAGIVLVQPVALVCFMINMKIASREHRAVNLPARRDLVRKALAASNQRKVQSADQAVRAVYR